MGNLATYKRVWGKHHDEVRRIYTTWREEMDKWDRYKGSEAGDEHIKAANDKYTAAVAAERERYWAEMVPVLKDMRAKVEAIDSIVTPPNDEQLRILQAVSYMAEGTMDYSTYKSYMDLCKDSSVARDTLYSMAITRVKGGENIVKPSSPDNAANTNYKVLAENARSLARWDGTSRSDAIGAFIQERHDGVPIAARHTDTAAAFAGDIDPTSSDFIHDVIGIMYDEDTIHYLD